MTIHPVTIVLVRTHLSSNLGAVARVAKNFGVSDLRLVEPAAPSDDEAHRLASGADDLLESCRRYSTLPEAVAEFEIVVTTSSLRGRARQRSLDLSSLPSFLQEVGPSARAAFVFGPEKSGLTEDELARASALLRLPTVADFPTMNLSHAAAVVLAASRLASSQIGENEGDSWAPAQEIEGMIDHWDRALEAIGFYDTGHRDRSLRDWRRLIAGRPLATRDVALLRGVANRILVSLRRSSPLSAHSSQPNKKGKPGR
ncbi:MAG TPA: TrmH family RNA methyltransferase [Thermoanaerobaculia bacterium]